MKTNKLSLFFAALAVLVAAVLSERAPTLALFRLETNLNTSHFTRLSPTHTTDRRGLNSRLYRRVNEVWDEAVCRGKKLLKAMNSPDIEAGVNYEPKQSTGQSPFHDIHSKGDAHNLSCAIFWSVAIK
jgi:hypothetical protein